jgi:hypothetical protein
MSRQSKSVLFAAAFIIALLYGVFGRGSLTDVAHESIRLHLRFIGASIYEYRANTGRWPSRTEDLAQTSLPRQSPYWKVMIDAGTNVVVWHDDLKPDPRDNAHVILVYHNKGLIAATGRHWVCWGDLRTEYIKDEELRAGLQSAK